MKKRFPLFYIWTVLGLLAAALVIDQSVTTAAQMNGIEQSRTYVIDAGHGLPDGGAVSCTGVYESDLNLQIAQRLKDLMELLGYNTKMIRTDEASVYTQGETIAAKKVSDLRERVRIVEETDNAVLISIHQNTFPDSRYGGAQVFYNAADGAGDLAKAIQSELTRSLGPKIRRMAKKAEKVYLLEHIQCPGVLIECGFLSNPEEEALLRTDSYQKKLSCIIACAVISSDST